VAEPRPRRCADCGAPLRPDQRYCLSCGARTAPRSALLERLHGRTLDGDGDAAAGAGRAAPGSGLRLPSPWVSALLVAAFLGFGVLLGNVASSPVKSSLAASRRPTRLILPQATPAPAPSSSGGEASPGASGGETPASEPEAAPARSSAVALSARRAPATSTPASTSAGAGEGGEAASGGAGSSGSEGSAAGGSSGAATGKLPPVKHVFVIALSNEPFASVFGPASASPYLSGTLEHRGELLVRYYAVAHEELANGIALLSGQGPTSATAANCPTYTDLAPGRAGANGQVGGEGCVYPPATHSLPGELAAKHLQWRAYVQGLGESGVGACAHPLLGQADPSAATPPLGEAYATFRNPVVYFHALIDSPACQRDDVGLASLASDLASPKRTPSFAYIAPDRCHDGDATPCAPGAPAGMAAADGFLRQVVPRILASKAYKDGGLLVITVDQAPASGELADSSSCCGQPQFPNVPASGPAGATHKGGGQVGALLLSPYVKPGGTSQEPFNHFSLLRTIEDFFGLAHLGYAGLASVSSLPASVFAAYKG
jgi:hypothetical protein